MRTTHSEQSPKAVPAEPADPISPTRPLRRTRTGAAVRLTAAVVAVLLAAVACSSSKKSSTSSASPTTAASATASASASMSATGSASASGTAPADPAAAKVQITANWEKFFNPATPLADKATLLQNGAALTPVLQGFSADPRVGQVSAKVSSVAFTSATSATVTYDLLLQGQTAQPGASGTSVLDGGTWKVSTSTLCALIKLSGNASIPAVPGCS